MRLPPPRDKPVGQTCCDSLPPAAHDPPADEWSPADLYGDDARWSSVHCHYAQLSCNRVWGYTIHDPKSLGKRQLHAVRECDGFRRGSRDQCINGYSEFCIHLLVGRYAIGVNKLRHPATCPRYCLFDRRNGFVQRGQRVHRVSIVSIARRHARQSQGCSHRQRLYNSGVQFVSRAAGFPTRPPILRSSGRKHTRPTNHHRDRSGNNAGGLHRSIGQRN